MASTSIGHCKEYDEEDGPSPPSPLVREVLLRVDPEQEDGRVVDTP